MGGKIYLITEDETDAKVIQQIIYKRGFDTKVVSLGRTRGISRLLAQLPLLIATAKSAKTDQDCIAVLNDLDSQQPDRKIYNEIARICREQRVAHIVAHDELEAWLLADSGVCQWLNIKPKNWDEQPKSKEALQNLTEKKQKRRFQERDRDQILAQLTGNGDKHSPSMSKAVKHLDNAPCTRP